MKLHLVTDDTPTGYALNTVLEATGWFEDTRVDTYGDAFPLLEEDTVIIGNFSVDPKDDYSTMQPEHYWYFPTYEPKVKDKHVFFNENSSSVLMLYAVLEKLRDNKFYGDVSDTLPLLVNALNTYSGKSLQYLNPKYDVVVETARNILAYAGLYKEKTDAAIIKSYLTVGKAGDPDVQFLVESTVFNDARYVEERLAHAQIFSTRLNADNKPTVSIGVVHAEQELGLIANEMAKRMVANGAKNYMAFVYKNGYVMVTSNVFEQMKPYFGEGLTYRGGAGTYSFFMTGLKDDTLFRALKTAFQGGK